VETLQPNSRDLMDISEDFRPIASKYAIISFIEEDAYDGTRTVVRRSLNTEAVRRELTRGAGCREALGCDGAAT